MNCEKLVLTNEWDKTFPKSEKVNHSKVTFHNRYGITLAADRYVPKSAAGKLPAIPQSAGFHIALYSREVLSNKNCHASSAVLKEQSCRVIYAAASFHSFKPKHSGDRPRRAC